MRRIILLVPALLLGLSAAAQEVTDAQKAAQEAARAIAQVKQAEVKAPKPNYWTNDLKTQITFGQTSLTNWAKGGYDNITLKAIVTGNANYKKNDFTCTNNLQLQYGFIYSEDKPILAKNMDRIFYDMKIGRKATNTLKYSANFSFLSQFSNSYKYPVPHVEEGAEATRQDWMDARQLISGLLSPATIDLGFGIEWAPSKWLTVNFAPLTGGIVTTMEESLRKANGMAVKKQYRDAKDEAGNPLVLDSYYRPLRFEFGAKLTVDTKLKINDNFSYNSQVRLFSDYLDNPQNMRVNWDNIVDWKLAKYFSLVVTCYLVYDDKVLIDGKKAIQFNEGLTFGFTYSIASKKK